MWKSLKEYIIIIMIIIIIIILSSWGTQWENQRKQNERQLLVEPEGVGDVSCNLNGWNCPQMLGMVAWRVGNRKRNQNYVDDSIVRIILNTGNSSGDVRRIIQNQEKENQPTLVWGTRNGWNNIAEKNDSYRRRVYLKVCSRSPSPFW